MAVLMNPNVAYVLLVGGLILATLALFAPGTGVLEVGAVFMLFLAGYITINLQINWWALLILAVGVFPFLLALRRVRHWALLLLAIASLIVGSVFLFRQPDGSPAINPVLAVFVSIVVGSLVWFIGQRTIAAIQQPPTHDLERLVGMVGEVRTRINPEGAVYVGGEEWSARSDTEIPAGSRVRVTGREGLILTVEPANKPSSQESQASGNLS
jgi:membrane-bound ClpP family serine protease